MQTPLFSISISISLMFSVLFHNVDSTEDSQTQSKTLFQSRNLSGEEERVVRAFLIQRFLGGMGFFFPLSLSGWIVMMAPPVRQIKERKLTLDSLWHGVYQMLQVGEADLSSTSLPEWLSLGNKALSWYTSTLPRKLLRNKYHFILDQITWYEYLGITAGAEYWQKKIGINHQ